MTTSTHLWAIGYDDMDGADRLRDEITRLGWEPGSGEKPLILLDIAVVVRHPDGTFTCGRKPFQGAVNILGLSAVGFLAGLVLGTPLTGATVGAVLGGAGTAAAERVGIREDFIREVEALMKPGTSALFVLDETGDLDMILHRIRGLGGTVVKTNVDLERAKLIQSTLAAAAPEASAPDDK
jgi:uncharacterized membrane protein